MESNATKAVIHMRFIVLRLSIPTGQLTGNCFLKYMRKKDLTHASISQFVQLSKTTKMYHAESRNAINYLSDLK